MDPHTLRPATKEAHAVARKRITRKDLKKPDEFISWTNQALAWLRQNRRAALWGSGVTLALVAAVGGTLAYNAARAREANAELGRAMSTLAAGNFAEAARDLTQVADRWHGSPVSPIAQLLAANSDLRAGELEAAIAAFEKLEPRSGELPPYLRQQLLFAWGAALEGKGQWQQAAAKYAAAGELSGPYTGDAVLGEARAWQQAGEEGRARHLYRKAYDQFPQLPERDVISSKAGSE